MRTFIAFTLGLVLLAASGCGSKTCSNCNGCCDSSGTCQLGTTANACGSSGAMCSQCAAGHACALGACSASSGGGSGGAGGSGTGGGTGTGGGATCSGNGVCSGTTAEWCPAGGTAGSVDCATFQGGQCAVSSSFGAWCSVPDGKTCKVPGQTHAGYLFCGDSNGPAAGKACDVNDGCVASTAATCNPDAGTVTVCAGDALVVDCTPWGQPVIQSCTSATVGGTGCSGASCTGVGMGLPCDSTRLCGPGLGCDLNSHTCTAFVEGAHAAVPQVVNLGGSVLTNPKVLAITYQSDTNVGTVTGYLNELTGVAAGYWNATTSEYGVGPLAIVPMQSQSVTPASLTDSQVQAMINSNTTGTSPAWGAPDPSTVYMVVVPQGTGFDDGSMSLCCQDYSGYHDSMSIGGTTVAYAIICECPGFDYQGETVTDELTATMSHELIEASTDPYVESNVAWGQTDDDHAAWTIWNGGEVSDMCEYNTNFAYRPPGAQYVGQKSWSNAAALAGNDPCVPADPIAYGAVAPNITTNGTLQYGGPWVTKAANIMKGTMGTVDVQAYTSGPMATPFTIVPYDYASDWSGGTRLLTLSLDSASANNGDTRHLTITPSNFDAQLHGALFILEVDWTGGQSYAVGTVVQ